MTKQTIGKGFMTVATMIYGFVPPFADFNATHAVNPLWPGHARFHVVWQVIITFWLAILGLYLIWTKREDKEFSLSLSFIFGLIVMGGFLSNTAIAHLYGGTLSDPNGLPPVFTDVYGNMILFSVGLVLLLIGYALAKSKNGTSVP